MTIAAQQVLQLLKENESKYTLLANIRLNAKDTSGNYIVSSSDTTKRGTAEDITDPYIASLMSGAETKNSKALSPDDQGVINTALASAYGIQAIQDATTDQLNSLISFAAGVAKQVPGKQFARQTCVSPRYHHRRWFALTSMAAAVIVIGLVPLQRSYGAKNPDPDSDQNFSMLQGHGVPVCEAYLELLNQTKFEVTPFCGRPDEGPVKGFEHLEGHFLSLEEIVPLFTKVWEFTRFDDQHHVQKFAHPNSDPKKSYWSTDPESGESLASSLRLGWMSVWSFAAPLDVNNNGSPVNVITWQGYGVTGTGARCGSVTGRLPWIDRYINQHAFVLGADSKSIDEDQTRLIFGAPTGQARGPMPAQVQGDTVPPGAKPFRPLADSIGIFKYEGRYYIETEDRPESNDAAALPPIRVFLREGGRTRQVCALSPQSVPVPED